MPIFKQVAQAQYATVLCQTQIKSPNLEIMLLLLTFASLWVWSWNGQGCRFCWLQFDFLRLDSRSTCIASLTMKFRHNRWFWHLWEASESISLVNYFRVLPGQLNCSESSSHGTKPVFCPAWPCFRSTTILPTFEIQFWGWATVSFSYRQNGSFQRVSGVTFGEDKPKTKLTKPASVKFESNRVIVLTCVKWGKLGPKRHHNRRDR